MFQQLAVLSNMDTEKVRNLFSYPNINIINNIYNIKGKTSVNVLISNYTNKDIKFNKGEYIG